MLMSTSSTWVSPDQPPDSSRALSRQLTDGTRVQITARVYDQLYYADESTVEVVIGSDTQAPTVRIFKPLKSSRVRMGL